MNEKVSFEEAGLGGKEGGVELADYYELRMGIQAAQNGSIESQHCRNEWNEGTRAHPLCRELVGFREGWGGWRREGRGGEESR